MNASPQSEVEIERLVTWLVATFEVENDVTLDEPAIKRLRMESTRLHAAWSLRRSDLGLVNLPFLMVTPSGPTHFEKRIPARQLAAIFDDTEMAPSAAEARARREAEAQQARDENADKNEKAAEQRRGTMYFAIGLIVIITIVLASIFGFSHHEDGHDEDHKKEMRH